MIDAVSTLLVQAVSSRVTPQAVASYSGVSTSVSDIDFVSSSVRMDNLQNAAILEYRSSKTGEIIRQYPTQAQIQAFKRAQAAEESHRESAQATAGAQASYQMAVQDMSGGHASQPSAPAPQAAAPAPVAAENSAPAPQSSGSSGGHSILV